MDRPWLANYPDGVPAQVDVAAYASLAEIFDTSCERFAALPAFSNFGQTITYAELESKSRAFAGYLQNELGLERGDRIAIMMPNLLQYPIALFGALRAGLTVVNTNPLYTARELEHQLNDSGATAIVIVENFAHVLSECIERTPIKHVVLTRMGDMLPFPKSLIVNLVVKYVKKLVPAHSLERPTDFKDALLRGQAMGFSPVAIGPDDLAFLQYTGGTTGVAKGAMLTHGNMIANMQQASAHGSRTVDRGAGRGSDHHRVAALPHLFALTANCLTFMKVRRDSTYLITNPRDMPGFVKEFAGAAFHRVITGVNTLFNGADEYAGFRARSIFPTLKLSLGGGMAVQRTGGRTLANR